eukprot:1030682-Pleurochrysis_carterae.AAC.1
MVLTLSLTRRTTEHSFSATKASPSRACAGSDRLRGVKAWCKLLNSVSDASASPLSSKASIMDSIARPAEGDDALASAMSKRMSVLPLFWHRTR